MKLPIGRLAFALATLTSVAVTGCGIGLTAPANPVTTPLGALQGRAMGGQQPVSGMSIYVLAANQTSSSGYGATSLQLLPGNASAAYSTTAAPNATTDANGNFTLTNTWSCPTTTLNQQVYLYGVGGNSGSGTNSAITEMAALGTCGNLNSSTFILMNEVTTVAAAYALSGFAVDPTHIADDESVSGNTTVAVANHGLLNAFANAGNLVNYSNGQALATTGSVSVTGLTGSITVPTATINTLADILAACINGSTSTGNCSTLFQNATTSGSNGTGTVPTDTATAAINIAHHPASNVAALYGLASSTPPFAGLSTQPNDFTLTLLYPQGGQATYGVAVDGFGTLYASYGGGGTVYKITPASGIIASSTSSTGSIQSTGTQITALTGLTNPQRLAIDVNNNVWIPQNSGTSAAISEWITGTGTPSSFNSINTTGSNLTNLTCVVLDQNNNLWATSAGTLYKATLLPYPNNPNAQAATVTVTTPTPTSRCGVSPTTGNLAVSGGTGAAGTLYIFTDSGTSVAQVAAGSGGLYTPYGVIADTYGNFWIGNSASSSSSTNAAVSVFNGSGAIASASNGNGAPFATTAPFSITPPSGDVSTALFSGDFDGAGNYYTGGYTYASGTTTPILPGIYQFNSAGTQTAVFTNQGTSYNEFFAVDPSGNLWFGGNKTIGEMIGVATPKVTPQVVANFPGLPAAAAASPTAPNNTITTNKVATRP